MCKRKEKPKQKSESAVGDLVEGGRGEREGSGEGGGGAGVKYPAFKKATFPEFTREAKFCKAKHPLTEMISTWTENQYFSTGINWKFNGAV